MPIGPELLSPIPGPNPGGVNLRHDPIYDKIKEARREDDEVPQGEWARELKKADWPLVIKLCSDAVANRSKDLQLVGWLTEALIRREGFAGLRQGIELCRGMLEQFWENLFPEIEDGDLELRAAPLDWIGGRLDPALKKVPLAKSGFDWFKYKESRSVGYESDAGDSDQKREARERAIADGKLTAEEFDNAFDGTPREFYVQAVADLDACGEAVDALAQVCEARFASSAPSFSGLRQTLEDIRAAANVLLTKKREAEPDHAAIADSQRAEVGQAPAGQPTSASGAAAVPTPVPRKAITAEPADRQDAYARIAAVAAWLRKQDTYSPVPYLMLRALRWGELRAAGGDVDLNLLEAPSTVLRTQIKRLLNDGKNDELIGVLEDAMAQPCGRAWLDLQRYFCTACDNAGGYDVVKSAVIAEVKALLADYPGLPQMTLLDDTPTANTETQKWLDSILPSAAPKLDSTYSSPIGDNGSQATTATPEQAPPDAFEMAEQAIRSGRAEQAIELLAREGACERSGRARFQRRVQLAQICMAANREAMARPILEGLAEEIDTRHLDDWESPEMLAHALGLLFRCVTKLKESPELKHKLYARICRLDPVEALQLTR
ncbi:MAG: type VI secretion system protein TssA [Terriglobales bacterium]